jgi:uncharacterized protein (DUF924 family)
MSAAEDVLDFWFGAPGSPEHGQWREAWFRKDPAFDAQIAQRFGPAIEAALGGGLRDWAASPTGALARILLLDQFTRNVFRDTARAFAGDGLALETARALVSGHHDLSLAPLRRAFVYLPFEHAEDMAMQDESVRLFTALVATTSDSHGLLDYARRHRDVIARFGRFPHRNVALRRASTADEQAFLALPGSRF